MKVAGILLLVLSVVLLVFGLDASGSFGSDVFRFFRGGPTDCTVWFYVGSAVAGAAGLGLLFAPRTRLA
jgi:hypothetical protein